MSARLDAVREADVVVLGAGAAGLSVVLGLAGRRIDLLAKGPLGQTGNSPLAQGGIAGAVGPGDSPALHAADSLAVAGEIADASAVARLTSDGPQRLAELVALGTRFDHDAAGQLDLAREAAHSRERILHARDATGAEVVRALGQALRERGGLSVFERSQALELVLDGGRVAGVLARHSDGANVLHRARAVALATGGIGRLFARTTNPAEATGDGLALAWRAGARLADLEFVQFHPTALDTGDDPMPLLTEALRGAGARLVTAEGRAIMAGRHRMGDLAPRDEVSRAVWEAARQGEDVRLDARAVFASPQAAEFPGAHQRARLHGLDPSLVALPVTAAAHYHMGGVAVDPLGRTSLRRLWACGEVAHTGLHGANRLASNSLLEAVVCGRLLGRALGSRASAPVARARAPAGLPEVVELGLECGPEWQDVRALMWDAMGPSRDHATLLRASHALRSLRAHLPSNRWLLRQRLLLAQAMVRAAVERRESRGAHWRRDYPRRNALWDGPGAVHAWS